MAWTPADGTRDRLWVALALILATAGLAYSNILEAPFVFDDLPGIAANLDIRVRSLDPRALWAAATSAPSTHRLVPNLSFALHYLAHGYDVTGYHVVNVAIHAVNGALVYLLARTVLRRAVALDGQAAPRFSAAHVPVASLCAALVFVAHPIQTQSVTYTVQRMTSLAALFGLASLLLYARARARPASTRRRATFLLAAGSWLLALASKETAIVLPGLVLLYEGLFVQDLRTSWLRSPRGLAAAGLALVAVAVVALIYIGPSPVERILATYQDRDFTLTERALTQLRVIPFYVSLILLPLPSRQNLIHSFETSRSLVDPASTAVCAVALVAVVVAALLGMRRNRLFSFCVLWFLMALALESSVIGLEMVFEHRLYLPMVAVSLAFSGLLFHLGRRRVGVATGIAFALVVALGTTTWVRNLAWGDELGFWSDVLAKNPASHRGHLNLGLAHKRRGDLDRAISHYHEALRLEPRSAVAHNNLGTALQQQGAVLESMVHYQRAIELEPGYVTAHYNLGTALAATDRMDDAVAHFSAVVKRVPNHAEGRLGLGVGLAWTGRPDEAIPHLIEAVRLAPDLPQARYQLGTLLARRGNCDAAIPHLAAAVALTPDDTGARAALEACRQRGERSTGGRRSGRRGRK